ncbi:lysosome-associated membrane glycoprotein 1 [Zootermopsis nevadensis]|uniref:lysosome-associated membrane glycoprotein 1 n=1 Tax=Zootermopsis nevadensis TaxID=136037 RepID=UPI000B8E8768|nr:lysosome-associated membrane glycoprotein 1 [Zootermopsis nevadensis]
MVGRINLTLTPSEETFPSIKDKNVISVYNNKTEFSTPLSKSYRCAKEQSFNLAQNGINETVGTIELSHVQLEAFHLKMDDLFGAAEDCEGVSSPDIVPIAVGCALVGLVAIVLIAYLVGRRRSQARGYLSM